VRLALEETYLNTIVFEDFEGTNRTKVTVTISLRSAEDKAEFLRRGTERGIEEGLSRLSQLLVRLTHQIHDQRSLNGDLK